MTGPPALALLVSRPKRWWLAAGVLGALLLVPFPVASNHVQASGSGDTPTSVRFDHDGDNEWWVEVLTQAGSGDFVAALDARAENGDWKPMQNQGVVNGWTKWAPSQAFRIPPGERVQFRAHMVDSATGNPSLILSCLFTHPAGAEQCPSTPPNAWTTTHVGNAGIASGSGDMAVGDADNDGRRDVTQATRNGIFHFEWTGSSWSRQQVGASGGFNSVTVGDLDGDGRSEIYAMRNNELLRYSFVNGAWAETVLRGFAEPVSIDMTLGDIDGIAGRELYVGLVDGTYTVIYKVRLSSAGAVVEASRIAMTPGFLQSLWIGDGDANGRFELYLGHGTSHTAKASRLGIGASGGWELTGIDNYGSQYGEMDVVAGDGDRDGRSEIYGMVDGGTLRRMDFFPATGWNVRTILEMPAGSAPASAPSGLFLGDGDGDGSQELYVPTSYGQLFQVRWNGNAWTAVEISRPTDAEGLHAEPVLVVVGDGDGDGRGEAYISGSFGTSVPGDDGHTEVFRVATMPPPSTTAFDASFSGVRGNEWWIQASVASTGAPLAKVDVRVNGGAWQPLAKQSWGGWAASYRATQGSIVQFRATATTGATDLSDCYQWIPPSNADASKVPCPSLPPPPAFDATFSNVKGNEWWVEAKVTGTQAIAKVEARVNCGATWHTLTLQSWGSYAKSFHVPSGAKVDFRATSTSGAVDYSSGYIWPQATPTGGC